MHVRPEPAGPRAGAGPAPSVPLWMRAVAWSQALFWGAWWAGYLWLPEGILRNQSGAAVLPIDHLPPMPRTLAIIGWNLAWMLLFAVAANLMQVRRWPLGFTTVAAMWALYGLLLGTNSFAVPMPGRLRPSLAVLLERAGFMELTAYLLAAIATASIGRWRQRSWLSGSTERVAPSPLRPGHWLLLGLSVLLLVAGAAREVVTWCRDAGGC